MEAELRNFQATIFFLCGSGIVPFKSSKSQTILYADAELRNFKSQYISCAKEYSMYGSRTAELQVTYKSVCGSGTSSHIIVCVWNLSGFLCKSPKCPGAHGRRPQCQSYLGGAVLSGGLYWDCFSLLRSYQAWSNQLTCDKDPDIRQTSRPKTARTKLPKGPIRRDGSDFLALQDGPSKGFSPVLPGALVGAYWPWHAYCESHVF